MTPPCIMQQSRQLMQLGIAAPHECSACSLYSFRSQKRLGQAVAMLLWRRARMSWICPCCRETIDDALEVCWQCGTATDGSRDPQFEHADDFEPEIPETRPQFQLGTLVWLMFVGCLVFALFGSIVNGGPNAL